MKYLIQTRDSLWPFIGNTLITLCFGAQFADDSHELIMPTERYFVDDLCWSPFRRQDVRPTHEFEENYTGQDDLERFTALVESCPEGAAILYRGWFQKRSAFRVPLHLLLQRFFRVREHWLRQATCWLDENGVDLDADLIVNIRGREYKHAWGGVNYFGVAWAQRAIETFPDVRRVFLVSDDDDVPVLADGTSIPNLSRSHNKYLDFCVLALARNVAIPKSSFSFTAMLALPHEKRVLYPDQWLKVEDYSHQMVEMLNAAPFIEKVRLPGY